MALIWELVACSVCSQIDTHFSNGRSSTSVLRCCSFQFHLMPFLPIEVQVIVHTGTATMVIMFPLLTFSAHLSRTMPDTNCIFHTLGTAALIPPFCPLFLFSALVLISASPSLPSIFVRFPADSHLSQIPIPLSLHIYRSSLAPPGPGECLSER